MSRLFFKKNRFNEGDLSDYQKKVTSMRRFVATLAVSSLIALSTILLVRVNTLSNEAPTMKEVVNAELQKISGDIKDRNGRLIAAGTDTGGVMDVKPIHLDPLLGVPVGYNKSSFYLRTIMGKELYGVSDPLSALIHSGLGSARAKGNSVTLTIDSELNKKVYKKMEDSAVDAGVALVYNYKTGEVIANVSYPDYSISGKKYKQLLGDNNLVSKTVKNSGGVNRCTQETYMPASSIKPIIYASLFTLDPSLKEFHPYCEGKWTNSKGTKITDHGHGHLDVKQAIACSCNIYAEKLSQKISRKKLDRFIRKKLGLNGKVKKTEEGLSYYSGKLDLSDADQQAMSMIGEGNANLSPLMLARLYGAILNKGRMAVPKYTLAADSNLRRVFDKHACQAILKGMRAAVTKDSGTCKILSDVKLENGKLYAKSGTGDDANRTCWCISGVRGNDKPYILLTGVFRCNKDNATKNAKELNKKILKLIYN